MLKFGLGDPDLDLGRELYLHKYLTTLREQTFQRFYHHLLWLGAFKGPWGGGGAPDTRIFQKNPGGAPIFFLKKNL